MESVLVIGVDGVSGGNLAVALQSRFQVSGIASRSNIGIAGCDITSSTVHDAATIQQTLRIARPDWIIFCGAASVSCWEDPAMAERSFDDSLAIEWAQAAKHAGIDFTMMSSDAVFTGPWMSHTETDEHFCETPQAARIRQIESEVLGVCPDALVIRANVFGRSPANDSLTFAESIIDELSSGSTLELDFLQHAAPILATDLAEMMIIARDENVCEILHLGSGERVNPFQFAERMAASADLGTVPLPDQTTLNTAVTGFGSGETTLNCSAARQLLDVPMPLIEDGIERFLMQAEDGHLDLLRCEPATTSRVA